MVQADGIQLTDRAVIKQPSACGAEVALPHPAGMGNFLHRPGLSCFVHTQFQSRVKLTDRSIKAAGVLHAGFGICRQPFRHGDQKLVDPRSQGRRGQVSLIRLKASAELFHPTPELGTLIHQMTTGILTVHPKQFEPGLSIRGNPIRKAPTA